MKSICDRDLVHERISDHASSKIIFRVQLGSLVNVSAISNETEGRINNFCITLTKKCKHCSRYQRYLLERHRVWLNKEMDIQGISTVLGSRENSNTNLINRLLLFLSFSFFSSVNCLQGLSIYSNDPYKRSMFVNTIIHYIQTIQIKFYSIQIITDIFYILINLLIVILLLCIMSKNMKQNIVATFLNIKMFV